MPDVFVSQPDSSTPAPAGTPAPVSDPASTSTQVPSSSHGIFSAFSLYPEDIDFETRDKEEKIILLLRAHMVTNIKWIFMTIVMFFVPTVISMFGILSSLPVGLYLIITLSWYLVTMAFALESFLSWYFNVHIVTNLRVIDVDFYNLIDKKVSDADISKIQDVSYTSFGIFRMFFNFGDVFIQTAAEVPEFDFIAVPDPERVTKIINELKIHDE